MLRRIFWVLVMLVLGACTLMPEVTATPQPVPPTLTPLPPPTASPLPPTPAPTATTLPPTEAPTTAAPTATPEPVLPTETTGATLPAITAEPHSGAPAGEDYDLVAQPSTPRQTQNFAHPDLGCAWSGVAGQIFDEQDLPVDNLVVVATGELDGVPIDMVTLTGLAPAYGPGGYEIVLAQRAVASTSPLYLQVFDLEGTPISFPVPFDTSADCAQNLVIVNFVRAP